MITDFKREDSNPLNHIDDANHKITVLHFGMIVACILIYFLLNTVIIQLAYDKEGIVKLFGFTINKYALSGIVSQGQVIVVILLTLNPVKRSGYTALILCAISGFAALYNVFCTNNSDALPGVVIPIISASISIIISRYAKSLKKQIHTVIEYGILVKSKEMMLHKLAFYDTLTGLPNRKKMMDQIELLISSCHKDNSEFTLVYLDLDNFKKINDSMGHNTGDEILKQVALRWKEKCHGEDLLGRIGGDEFIILIRHKAECSELAVYLNDIKEALNHPILVDRKEFHISASCGITRYPQDGKNAQELMKNADIALYKAKTLGKNDAQVFCQEMQEEVVKKIQLENGLLSAIKNHELTMVFQPQYIGNTKELRGYEALIRWKHPEMGAISPAEFIPIAEETGSIIEIGRWIIETVLTKFNQFEKKWKVNSIVSINISVVQLLDPFFVDMIKEILYKTGFDSNHLEFEITESVFISSPDHVIDVIQKLKEMGIRFALDDFGTGYASLKYLHMLPVNILKIDKTFIDGIQSYRSLNKMVGAIITLSHQLGIEVVAEGVEREEQLHYLVKHKCDYIQGYYLGKPMAEEQIIQSFKQTG